MFGFLKIFKRKPVETPVYEDVSYYSDETQPLAEPQPQPQSRPVRAPAQRPAAPARQPRNGGNGGNGGGAAHANGRGVELPLQVILSNLPLELQPRVQITDVGDATICVPLEKVLSQLSRGSVKITFGELRQAAPDVFSSANDRDRVLVPLPLSEILARLNPALITRRRVQKQVEVPEDISSPFDPEQQGAIFSVGPAKPEPPPAPAPVFTRQAPAPPPRASVYEANPGSSSGASSGEPRTEHDDFGSDASSSGGYAARAGDHACAPSGTRGQQPPTDASRSFDSYSAARSCAFDSCSAARACGPSADCHADDCHGAYGTCPHGAYGTCPYGAATCGSCSQAF
jgi:hypothetical protein